MSRELRGWGERGRGGAALLASPRVSFLLLLEGFFPRCQSGPIEKKRVGDWGGGDPGLHLFSGCFCEEKGNYSPREGTQITTISCEKGKGKEPGAARKGPELAVKKKSRSDK